MEEPALVMNDLLMLAISELGGGWGFICRLADRED
jgi:hypothetical protein